MQISTIGPDPKPTTLACFHEGVAGPRRHHVRGDEGREKEEIFRSALAMSGRSELKRIRVRLRDDFVQLSGFVTSYYLKQLAQEIIRPLALGLRIKNQIDVAQ